MTYTTAHIEAAAIYLEELAREHRRNAEALEEQAAMERAQADERFLEADEMRRYLVDEAKRLHADLIRALDGPQDVCRLLEASLQVCTPEQPTGRAANDTRERSIAK